MEDKKPVELEVMLDYLAGTCEPATEVYIRQQLQDPDSQESRALRELDALTEYCKDGKGLERATREALTSWLGDEAMEEIEIRLKKRQEENSSPPADWTDRTQGPPGTSRDK